MLDSRRLLYFLRIVETGSFSRAAAKLGVAQPALSHHIRKLEEYLDVTLLVRRSSGVTLTEAGANLLKYTRAIIGHIDEAEYELRRASHRITGSVSLGLASSVAKSLTPLLLREISRQHPGITVRIVEGASTALAEWIQTERLDLALNLERVAQRKAVPLFKEDLFLVAARGKFGRARGGTISFKDAVALPLVLPAQPHTMRMLIERTAAMRGLPINVAYEVDGFEPLKASMLAGLGYSILSWGAIETENRERKVSAMRIVSPAIQRTIVLDSSPGGRSSRAVLAVHTTVADVIARLVRDDTWRGVLLYQPGKNPG